MSEDGRMTNYVDQLVSHALVARVPAAIQLLEELGLKLDIIFPGGTHRYYSTHCRHGDHEACSATAIEGRQFGEQVRIARRPASCKTCSAPCICDCHTENEEKVDA